MMMMMVTDDDSRHVAMSDDNDDERIGHWSTMAMAANNDSMTTATTGDGR